MKKADKEYVLKMVKAGIREIAESLISKITIDINEKNGVMKIGAPKGIRKICEHHKKQLENMIKVRDAN